MNWCLDKSDCTLYLFRIYFYCVTQVQKNKLISNIEKSKHSLSLWPIILHKMTSCYGKTIHSRLLDNDERHHISPIRRLVVSLGKCHKPLLLYFRGTQRLYFKFLLQVLKSSSSWQLERLFVVYPGFTGTNNLIGRLTQKVVSHSSEAGWQRKTSFIQIQAHILIFCLPFLKGLYKET